MSKSEAKSLLERLVQAPVEALPGLLSGYHAEPTVEHAAEPALQTAVEPAHAAADSALLPALEVDHLLWPGVCDRLDAAAGADLDRLADNLAAEISPQHNLVAVAASRRGEGATTVLLCTAARLAQKGLKVVLVDADLEGARLGRRLGLTPDAGWERVLAGRLPLAEALITSSRQRLTVLPLADPLLATDAVRSRAVANLQTLRKAFDVVLVKLGPLDDPHSQGVQLACGLCDDLRLLLVCDNRAIGPASRSEICAVLTAGGVAEIFLAENFV
jgi:Mrp family chromosome partitioning ATPase